MIYQYITLCAGLDHPSTERERKPLPPSPVENARHILLPLGSPIMDLLKSWCKASTDGPEIDACGLHEADREPGHDGPSERRRGGRIHNGMSWVVCPHSWSPISDTGVVGEY